MFWILEVLFIKFLYHNSIYFNIFDLTMQISERDRSLRIFTTKTWHNNDKKENDQQYGFAKLTPIYRGDIKKSPKFNLKKYFRLIGKTYF